MNRDYSTAWAGGVSTALKHLKQPTLGLEPPPGNVPLSELIEIRSQLGVNDAVLWPAADSAQRWSAFLQENYRAELVEKIHRLINETDVRMAAALDHEQCDAFVLTADFGERCLHGNVPFVIGIFKSLRRPHQCLRIPPEDSYHVDGRPGLVLGPAPGGRARAFYPVGLALRLTAECRKAQASQEAEQARLRKLEAEAARQRIENSPAGQIDALQRRVRELETSTTR